MCKPMGNFAENLNLGKRVHSPPPRKNWRVECRMDITPYFGYDKSSWLNNPCHLLIVVKHALHFIAYKSKQSS